MPLPVDNVSLYIALLMSLATCRYADTDPRFAICVIKRGLPETSLLQVMHLHSDGQYASK